MIPLKVESEKAEQFYEEIKDKINLKNLDAKCLGKDLKPYFIDEQGLKKLITAPPDEIREIAEKYNQIPDTEQCKKFKDSLKKIFINEYKNIDKLAFIKRVGIITCPYCNRNFVIGGEKKRGKRSIKGWIDHFFPKAKYPLLAVSYFNLIPSCPTCNQMKSEKDPLTTGIVSPYEMEQKSKFEFSIQIKDLKAFSYKLNEIEASLDLYLQAPEGNNETFLLQETYQKHMDVVAEVFFKKLRYNKSYIKSLEKVFTDVFKNNVQELMSKLNDDELDWSEILKQYKNLSVSNDDIYRLVFGIYKDFPDKRPLSKLISDIVKQMDI